MVDSPQRNFSNVTSSAPPTSQYEDDDIDSVTLKWLRIVFYGVICIVGTVGNTLVILAYRNPRMRSVTNLFIANLGVADLTVTLINVPITVAYSALDFWPFGAFLCKAIPYILGITIFSSVGTLIAIAADRYRAIVHPLLPRIRTRHAIMIIAAIWIVALIYPTPLLIYQKLTEDGRCSEEWPSDQARKIYTVILFVALYLIPLIAISVLYFLICHNLNTSESAAQEGKCLAHKYVTVISLCMRAQFHSLTCAEKVRKTRRKRKFTNTQQIICCWENLKYCCLFRNNLLTSAKYVRIQHLLMAKRVNFELFTLHAFLC